MPYKDLVKKKKYMRGYQREWQKKQRREKTPYAAKKAQYMWAYSLWRRYGITVEQYESMLHAQENVCAICGRPPKTKRLNTDHDHRGTKRVRGLLCIRCNKQLWPGETPERLRKAAEYLEREKPLGWIESVSRSRSAGWKLLAGHGKRTVQRLK